MLRIGILGLGEAGRIFAEGLQAAGNEVVGFDPAPVHTPDGVTRVESAVEAAKGSDLVLSLVTARWASAVSKEVAPVLSDDSLLIDLNSGAPATKVEAQEAMGDRSEQFIDGAVMGSVPANKEKTRVLMSGPRAAEAVSRFVLAGGNAEAAGTEVGMASQSKLLRSIFAKGLGALIVEALNAAEAFSDRQSMLDIMKEYLVGGEETINRLNESTRLHSVRRAHEVEDALSMVEEVSQDWPMTLGSARLHGKLATDRDEASLIERLKNIPTAALGDGSDRLGFADSSVKPIWAAPRTVGRARTVHAHAGDNLGVHAAIKKAQPGEVLVVAGDGHTDRALMGELIANRLINRGVLAFITDGAVRDRDDLENMGFPVWAAGQSPAGPYKNGPFRVDTDVSLGGTVCHPGDYVVADSDGVCFIRPEKLEEAVLAGEAVLAEEARRMKNILAERSQNPN